MLNKKIKHLAAGMIIGGICTLSVQVLAAPSVNIVTAFVDDLITFKFNGEKKVLPSEYSVLVYKDRTYVPARFIAEELGAEVDWDYTTKTIEITSQSQKKIGDDEKETEQNDKKNEDDKKSEVEINYEKLPISKNYVDMLAGITTIVMDEDNSDRSVYITIENKKDIPLQLLQMETKIEVDGIEYSMKKVPAHKLDSRWYNDVKKDESLEGYITLPNNIHKNPKKMRLVITILKNDAKQEKREIEFNISLDS